VVAVKHLKKPKMLLLNAISLNMLPDSPLGNLEVRVISAGEAAAMCRSKGVESAVGHADTAAIFSNLLGVPVEPRWVSVTLAPNCPALVGQYRGLRLPEGATFGSWEAWVDWYVITWRTSP
jgi:hypothetical protein